MNRHTGATNRTREYEPNQRAADKDDPLGAGNERAEDFGQRRKDIPLCEPSSSSPHRAAPPPPAVQWLP